MKDRFVSQSEKLENACLFYFGNIYQSVSDYQTHLAKLALLATVSQVEVQ